ncbi:Retrovirus-related Pol polyprotein from type-1 retrotransposable element R2 [Portunus trituberculatus]|uniref:Retrovirus-related Pol polyprotein from type-1 retrotransposable element R2 n=1 Tax=Portunus trituberculatus TaxID=210409 RepID=A0A5B7KFL7_PORTR|nr:Retrovirus-related Pol polyprotein from type-1 retrotransposable element R2 [Portunus trituberculatus]
MLGKSYKYLGLEVGPTKCCDEPGRALAALVRGLGAVQRSPLQPQQKLWAVKNVVVPKHQYARIHGKSTKSTLKSYDQEIKMFVKKALHLPLDTPNDALYARECQGGWGCHSYNKACQP